MTPEPVPAKDAMTNKQKQLALACAGQKRLDKLRSQFKIPNASRALKKDTAKGPDYKWIADILYVQGNRLNVPNDMPLKLRIMRNFHDSPTAGHMGRDRTASMIRRWFYWPNISKEVEEYVRTCDACQRSKVPRHQPYGELTPIPVPSGPWLSITIDFITDLPESRSWIDNATYDCIMVVMDRFSKMCHYVPCRNTMTSKQFAAVFLREIYRLHGLIVILAASDITIPDDIYELWKLNRGRMSINAVRPAPLSRRDLIEPYHWEMAE